jgi:hypothetical protein
MSHTKGPWMVWSDEGDGISVCASQGYDDAGHVCVALVKYSTLPDGSDPGRDDKANANLIAASPELLESCKWFIGELEAGNLVRDISRDAQADWLMRMMQFTINLQKAVSAVAKAEGR